MSNFIEPQNTPSRVKTAGKRFRADSATPEDIMVLDNWRASHAYILNTFQAALRNRARGLPITVGQRLKRRPTIIDKLKREPSMQLNTMHDLAGCRLIFENQDRLSEFRKSLHASRGMKHILKNGPDDKYNYISKPKFSGYRGIHDVYEYRVRSEQGQKWDGLHIEIQYRTLYQHAWATAVEVADLINLDRIKFSQASPDSERFFRLSSELIARTFEAQNSSLADISSRDLVAEFNELEDKIGMLGVFQNLVRDDAKNPFRSNTILIFYFAEDESGNQLEVKSFPTIKEAVVAYGQLEASLSGKADVVFVRGENEASLRSAFRNYFKDTTDFVSFVNHARSNLPMIG